MDHALLNKPAAVAALSRFRITFHDGFALTTAATDAEAAEVKAKRQHAGFVRAVKFLGKVGS